MGAGAGAIRLVKLDTLPRKPLTEAEGARLMLPERSEAGEALGRDGELAAEDGAEERYPSWGLVILDGTELPISCALPRLCMEACAESIL